MPKGIVIKTTGSWYSVKSGEKVIPCKIKGKFRIKGIRATNPVAVGDSVEFAMNNDNTGIVTAIDERKNYLIRRSPNLSKEYQLIAANVDQAWLMVSLRAPKTHYEFIDRFLVTAEAYNIPAKIIFNKTDLYNEDDLEELKLLLYVYKDVGYEVYKTSAVEPESLMGIKAEMKDRINVISGNSGVGKSTIINIIDPELNLKTAEISGAHQSGKHTTTFSEMHSLSFGGYVIDTPGIRGFGLIDFDKEELFHFFPEIFKKSHDCKFYNCTHIHEPGCAVIEAVENGEIFESRYSSYLSLMEDQDEKYR
ncbi:MAG: ribosome small subunit-dependent GTPase A [Bacteroidales bacterium]